MATISGAIRVGRNDSLIGIADRLGVSLDSLLSANPGIRTVTTGIILNQPNPPNPFSGLNLGLPDPRKKRSTGQVANPPPVSAIRQVVRQPRPNKRATTQPQVQPIEPVPVSPDVRQEQEARRGQNVSLRAGIAAEERRRATGTISVLPTAVNAISSAFRQLRADPFQQHPVGITGKAQLPRGLVTTRTVDGQRQIVVDRTQPFRTHPAAGARPPSGRRSLPGPDEHRRAVAGAREPASRQTLADEFATTTLPGQESFHGTATRPTGLIDPNTGEEISATPTMYAYLKWLDGQEISEAMLSRLEALGWIDPEQKAPVTQGYGGYGGGVYPSGTIRYTSGSGRGGYAFPRSTARSIPRAFGLVNWRI